MNILKMIQNINPHNYVKGISRNHLRHVKEGSNEYRQYIYSQWFDKYNISYSYDEEHSNILNINISNNCPSTIVRYINSLPNCIDIVVIEVIDKAKKTDSLNKVLELLSKYKTSKNIFFSTTYSRFKVRERINAANLPSNVKIGNIINYTDKFYGQNSLDWWSLHATEEELEALYPKLSPNTKKRLEYLNKIAKDFYTYTKKKFPNLDYMTNLEKANLAFEYCSKNITYDFGSTARGVNGVLKPRDDCDFSSDPIETLERKKGVCTGRSRLMKLLLNNRYMKVPCFLSSGYTHSGEGHEWIEVFDNWERYYYDLSFGVKGRRTINHEKILHEDFEIEGIEGIENIERRQHHSNEPKKLIK